MTIRLTSADRVECRCPDRRPERVRAVVLEADNGGWVAYASQHGPGTDCGGEGPKTWSYWTERFASREDAIVAAHQRCGRETCQRLDSPEADAAAEADLLADAEDV